VRSSRATAKSAESEERRALPSALARLSASGPFAPDADELMLYGRLVGAWVVEWVRFDVRGKAAERRRGEWHVAWVLGGRGVQDVIWAAGAPPEHDGTTLRCWDPELGAWRATFMSPGDRQFVTLVARAEGDRIVQDITKPTADASLERWTFSEITDAAFPWQAETPSDGGRTWTLTHEMKASRRAP
jgi:hypothetical protein